MAFRRKHDFKVRPIGSLIVSSDLVNYKQSFGFFRHFILERRRNGKKPVTQNHTFHLEISIVSDIIIRYFQDQLVSATKLLTQALGQKSRLLKELPHGWRLLKT